MRDVEQLYNTGEAEACLGISFRRIDHGLRKAGIQLALMRASGSGRHRMWTAADMWAAAVLADLLRQKVPIDYLLGAWDELNRREVRPHDKRWLIVDTDTGDARVEGAPGSDCGVWRVPIGSAVDPVEERRRGLDD